MARVVKCNVYCYDPAHFTTFNEIYGRYFPVDQPARIFLCGRAGRARSTSRSIASR